MLLEKPALRRVKIAAKSRNRFASVPIATVLTASFGTLLVLALLSVLGISLVSGLANTRDLLIDKSTAAMDAARGDLTDLLNPAEEQVRYLAELIHSGTLDVSNHEQLHDFLLGSIAGTPQVDSLSFISPSYQVTAANRKEKAIIEVNASADSASLTIFNHVSKQNSGSWGPLIYVSKLGETVMSFRQPITKNGEFIGALFATIPVSAINAKLKETTVAKGGTRFVLYGKDSVLLQHPSKALKQATEKYNQHITQEGAVPKLDEIDDPVLREIWSPDSSVLNILGDNADFSGHHLQIDENGYIYFYSTLEGYSDKDLIVGYWIRDTEAEAELKRLALAGIIGLAIIILSALISLFLGRKIARPILALSHASQQISKLEFDNIQVLPASRFKEVNEANDAYNTMVRGLIWFETYVPKTLVRKLINTGEALSEQRTVTVMFTDIVSFTSLAEDMQSEEVAEFLNHHFQLITSCIEAEGGTVDKFIGDAVMAFWGAPEVQEDHAARACRAALAIREGLHLDNKERRAQGYSPVQMRIGIHTGPLVVGNIGSKGRSNYTVVGDTVNIAQRVEQLGKTLCTDESTEIFTLITDVTYSEASSEISVEEVGDRNVKGRHDTVKIYRLT
jgi:class 3 adenylate cyclase